jgi:alcohol dehydrogenase class IV
MTFQNQDLFPLRKFVAPEFVFGEGALLLAGQYSCNLGGKKVLVVSDEGVMKAGITGEVLKSLQAAGLPVVMYSNVTPNPRDHEVAGGAELFTREKCNMIVAVGGGSPMDCAKGIGILCANPGQISDYEGVDKVPSPCPPLLCIPTTAGTAADVSQFSIIADSQRRVKMAIVSKAVVPDLALIDPVATFSMPPDLTAHTGLDALCHAIEAYVSTAHSFVTDLHALRAIELLSQNLIPAIHNPENLEYRGNMVLGSLTAGLAFSNASLGAVHAMAHSLGGMLDLPHGLCNAILLGPVMEFNYSAVPERFAAICRAMGGTGTEGPTEVLELLTLLREKAGVPRSFSPFNCPQQRIPELTEKAMLDPCMVTNPRRPENSDIQRLYEHAF